MNECPFCKCGKNHSIINAPVYGIGNRIVALTTIETDDLDVYFSSKWSMLKKSGYVKGSQKTPQYLHRLITECRKGFVVDHINRNVLDNRRSNLRVMLHKQNLLNRSGPKHPLKIDIGNQSVIIGFFDKNVDLANEKYNNTNCRLDGRHCIFCSCNMNISKIPVFDTVKNGRKAYGFALADTEDYLKLITKRWFAATKRKYPCYSAYSNQIYMHRFILNPPDNLAVDHINGDIFDNRKQNLRLATTAENAQNIHTKVKSKSGFRGVTWRPHAKKWAAKVKLNNKNIWLGYFVTAELADEAVRTFRAKYMPFSQEALEFKEG